MITGFSHINRRVRNLDETIEFYTKHLGFYLLRRYTTDGREGAYVGLGDILFELGQAPDGAEIAMDETNTRLGLSVTDLDALVNQLRSEGVEIVSEPAEMRTFWGRQAAIKDPSGYVFALREWRAPDGPAFFDWQPKSDRTVRIA